MVRGLVDTMMIAGTVCMAAALASCAAQAQETITIGVEPIDYFPLYAARDEGYVGFAREVFDAFAADQGLEVVYEPMPIRRLYAALLSGGIDIKFPDDGFWAADIKGDADIRYSSPFLPYIDGTLVQPHRLGEGIETIGALGTVAGFTPFAWLDTLDGSDITLVENAGFVPLLRQASLGRVDGAYANVTVAEYQLETMLEQPGVLVFDADLPHIADSYRASSATRPDLIAAFDTWLEENAALKNALMQEYGIEGRS